MARLHDSGGRLLGGLNAITPVITPAFCSGPDEPEQKAAPYLECRYGSLADSYSCPAAPAAQDCPAAARRVQPPLETRRDSQTRRDREATVTQDERTLLRLVYLNAFGDTNNPVDVLEDGVAAGLSATGACRAAEGLVAAGYLQRMSDGDRAEVLLTDRAVNEWATAEILWPSLVPTDP